MRDPAHETRRRRASIYPPKADTKGNAEFFSPTPVMLSDCEASLFSYLCDNGDPSQSLRMTINKKARWGQRAPPAGDRRISRHFVDFDECEAAGVVHAADLGGVAAGHERDEERGVLRRRGAELECARLRERVDQ